MTTIARQKHQPHEREIAEQLGLSDAQLAALLRIRAGYWPGNAAACLEDKGLAFREREDCSVTYGDVTFERWRYTGKSGLTEAGEAMLRRARALGY